MARITPPKIKMVEDFKSFLLKHSVVGLAVGVVIGAAVGKVVKALVDDIIMPIVGLLTTSGEWRTAKIWIFGVGDLAGNLLDFTIVAFVVFMGIVAWAYSRGRRGAFEAAAQAPFALPDEDAADRTGATR
jgi:large conductance mechanosensitive channel protein